MLRAYKYRIYPTESQREIIEQTFGCCRLVYNMGLRIKIDAWKNHERKVSAIDLCYHLVGLKEECDWMSVPDSQALQASVKKIDVAFKNFYNGSGYPKFKKRSNRQSFQCPNNTREIDFENQLLTIPKIKNIPIRISREFIGKIKTVTISREPSGKYFASILVDTQRENPPKEPIINAVGIDMGVKVFATLSDGREVPNMKFLENSLKRLKVLQQRASKKKRGSKNQKKAYKKVAILHEKVANQRRDFLHKASDSIAKNYDTVCMEDLAIKNMTKRAKPKQNEQGKFIKNNAAQKSGLNKSLLDAGFGMFKDCLKYKCEWRGNNFVQVWRFFPSSKKCVHCGEINAELKLSDREWDCKFCAGHNHRDPTASANILNEGLRILMFNSARVGSSVEPVESRTLVRATKQEYKQKEFTS